MNRILTLAALGALAAAPARADVIVDQLPFNPDLNVNGVTSQQYLDNPTFNTYTLDDFSTTRAFAITTLTVEGSESVLDTLPPNLNQAVVGKIYRADRLPGPGATTRC